MAWSGAVLKKQAVAALVVVLWEIHSVGHAINNNSNNNNSLSHSLSILTAIFQVNLG